MNKIARVFPRKTKASPDDELAFFGEPPRNDMPEIDEVHVSVTFAYDLPKAERLAELWGKTGIPIKLGGPATGQRGEDFTPGMYLKRGYVITSRGCDNACWFCSVPKREGRIRELPIRSGNNILDDNLLACSEEHMAYQIGSTEAHLEKLADTLAVIREPQKPERPPATKKLSIGDRLAAGNEKVKAYKEQKAQTPENTTKHKKEDFL